MKSYIAYAFIALILALIPNLSTAAIDSDASIIKLRTSCIEGGATLDNCFESMDDVINWILTTRQPNSSAPLLVDIGPGDFQRVWPAGLEWVESHQPLALGIGRRRLLLVTEPDDDLLGPGTEN